MPGATETRLRKRAIALGNGPSRDVPGLKNIQRQLLEVQRQRAQDEARRGRTRVKLESFADVTSAQLLPAVSSVKLRKARDAPTGLDLLRDPARAKRARCEGSLTVKEQLDSEDEVKPEPKSPGDPDPIGESFRPRGRVKLRGRMPRDGRGTKILGSLLVHLDAARQQLANEKAGKTRPRPCPAVSEREVGKQRHAGGRDHVATRVGADVGARRVPAHKIERDSPDSEIASLQHRLEQHYALMKNFIRTQAEPTIFFMPRKLTRVTERQLKETRAAIEQKIMSLEAHLHHTQIKPHESDDFDAEREDGDDEEEEEVQVQEREEVHEVEKESVERRERTLEDESVAVTAEEPESDRT